MKIMEKALTFLEGGESWYSAEQKFKAGLEFRARLSKAEKLEDYEREVTVHVEWVITVLKLRRTLL